MTATLPAIPLAAPFMDEREEQAAAAAIRSGWVAQGPQVAKFEQRVAEFCQVEHAVALSSCTAALHLALVALEVGPGDEVICPSMSFIATANSIVYTGATPVFADVDPQTYNLDPDATEAAITPRTKAILVVHQVGLPADLDRFLEIGRRRGVCIIEDAACAMGSRYKNQPIGGHSEMACFSFHPRKIITTGEGGMITTNSAAHADKLRRLRQHGMTVPDTIRHAARRVIVESYEGVGYNYRMSDIQAAVGCVQMDKLDEILHRRRRLAARYNTTLSHVDWLSAPLIPSYAQPNYQSYAVQLKTNAPLSRDDLMQHLLDQGVSTRRGIMLAHRESAHQHQANAFPQSELASDRSLLLPLYPHLTDGDVDHVLSLLTQIGQIHLLEK